MSPIELPESVAPTTLTSADDLPCYKIERGSVSTIYIRAQSREIAEAIADRLPFEVWHDHDLDQTQEVAAEDASLPIHDAGDLSVEDGYDLLDEYGLTHITLPAHDAEA